jgi:hypothetical protein
MYKIDFEKFCYSLELPAAATIINPLQIETAIHAIHMLRGRHQRIIEIRKQHTNNSFHHEGLDAANLGKSLKL